VGKWNDSSEPFIEFLEGYLLDLAEISDEEERMEHCLIPECVISGDALRLGDGRGEDIRCIHQIRESCPRL